MASEQSTSTADASATPQAMVVHPWVESVLFSEEAIQQKNREIAAQINKDFEGKSVVVIVCAADQSQ
jgi:hypothetical protein